MQIFDHMFYLVSWTLLDQHIYGLFKGWIKTVRMKTQSCVETEKRQVNRQICNKKRSQIFVEELFTKDYLSSH